VIDFRSDLERRSGPRSSARSLKRSDAAGILTLSNTAMTGHGLTSKAIVGFFAGAATLACLAAETVDAFRRDGSVEVREVHVIEEDARFALPYELEQNARDTGNALPTRAAATQGR